MVAHERPQKSTLVARLNQEPVRLILGTGLRHTRKTFLVRRVQNHIDRPCRYLAVDEPDPVALRQTGLRNVRGFAGPEPRICLPARSDQDRAPMPPTSGSWRSKSNTSATP